MTGTTVLGDIEDALKLDDTERCCLGSSPATRTSPSVREPSKTQPPDLSHRLFRPHPTPTRAAPDADRISLQVGEGPLTDPDLDGDARQLSGANGK
jgi:hypothetical protein